MNFREKADFFNNLFASWCTPIVNVIKLPLAVLYRAQKTNKTLSFKYIVKTKSSLNLNKNFVHNDTFVNFLTVCDAEAMKPLVLILEICI